MKHPYPDWRDRDQQWQAQSQQYYERCQTHANPIAAKLAFYAYCLSEESRLDWKYWMLKHEESN